MKTRGPSLMNRITVKVTSIVCVYTEIERQSNEKANNFLLLYPSENSFLEGGLLFMITLANAFNKSLKYSNNPSSLESHSVEILFELLDH